MNTILVFVIALLISLGFTSYIRKIAIKFEIGSLPDIRKIHVGFVPSLGGLAISGGFFLSLLAIFIYDPEILFSPSIEIYGLVAGLIIMLITGTIDDTKGIPANFKFIAQLFAATLAILLDLRFPEEISLLGYTFHLGLFSILLSYIWLIWVTNAINIMDGLDGLAAGTSVVYLTAFASLFFIDQNIVVYYLCIALIGSLFGFLRYNYHPAKIFMGDTGSLFLGFIIASITLIKFRDLDSDFSIVVPVAILGLPLIDSALAFIRRLVKGRHPFHADKDHLHHRLIFLGLSHRQAVHLLYMVAFSFAIAGYLIAINLEEYGLFLLGLLTIGTIFGLRRLGYLEARKSNNMLFDKNILRETEKKPPLFMYRFWYRFLLFGSDIVAINLSLFVTYWFRYNSNLFDNYPQLSLNVYLSSSVFLILTLYYVALFSLNGLYKIKWDISRFDIVIRLIKVIFFGSFILFILTFETSRLLSAQRLVLLFFTFMLCIFISFGRVLLINILKHYSILEYAPHNTLLLGSEKRMTKVIRDIQDNPHLLYRIVGIISEEENKKSISSIKVLGSFRDFENIVHKYKIEEIIIAISDESRAEILSIIVQSESLGLSVKIIPDIYNVFSGHKKEEIIDHPFIRLFPEKMKMWQWIVKRFIDINVAFWGIIILSPLFFIIASIQLIYGIYPFFVIDNKIGKHGHVFGQLLLNMGNIEHGVDKFLYRSYIYKLPQLVNLLIGSMSLVGPRPESPKVVKKMRKSIQFYNHRFLIRPGITGWAQIKFRYSISMSDRKEMLKYDLFYLENMSIMFDLRIIIRSLLLFFKAK